MKQTLRAAHTIVLTLLCLTAVGQDNDFSTLRSDTLIQQFDSLFSSEDSLSIFRLIDSLIQAPAVKETSQLALRLGYNSNVVAASRTLGFNQFGLAPGIAYYHKSGLYGDATGYWSPEYSPNYYLTLVSAGYLKTVSEHWSFMAEYSHYFYTAAGDSNAYFPYTNNLGVAQYFDFKPFTFRLDYYFYFGEKNAHRLMPGISVPLQKKKWLGFDRVTLFPSVNVLLGSERVVTGYVDYPDRRRRALLNLFLPAGQQYPLQYATDEVVFGVMNYSATLPLSITKKHWNMVISYTYNIPKSLPHEDVGLQNGGYLSFSVSRYLEFKAR